MSKTMWQFGFCYATTDGRVWGSHIEAPDWETALNAVADLQGWQCGARCAVIDADSDTVEYEADPPLCPPHLRDHPAGRMHR